MLSMALEHGLDMEEDGAGLVDGPTDIDLIGDGVVTFGEDLVLVLGALITKRKL